MERAKSIYFIVGIMLFVLAVVMAYLSVKGLLAMTLWFKNRNRI